MDMDYKLEDTENQGKKATSNQSTLLFLMKRTNGLVV